MFTSHKVACTLTTHIITCTSHMVTCTSHMVACTSRMVTFTSYMVTFTTVRVPLTSSPHRLHCHLLHLTEHSRTQEAQGLCNGYLIDL